MAISAGFNARVYGRIQGTPPFTGTDGTTSFDQTFPFNSAPLMNLPSDGVLITPLPNGTLVGNTYVYSVISLPPSGLNVHGLQYASDSQAATLATNRG